MTASEAGHLAAIAANSLYAAGPNRDSVLYSFEIFRRYLRPGSILELGPAEGVMTEHLAKLGQPMTLVDGAERFCADLKQRFPKANVVHTLFEDWHPKERFDNVVLGHVMEHVADSVPILKRVRDWLSDDGRVLAAVPNARSLHRQAAVMMGLLEHEEQLNDTDRHHGHRRVYNPESFRRDFIAAGLEVEHFGGYWMKPVSNAQIEKSWTPQMLAAFMRLGERYPDIAGEIYVIARRAKGARP